MRNMIIIFQILRFSAALKRGVGSLNQTSGIFSGRNAGMREVLRLVISSLTEEIVGKIYILGSVDIS